MEIGRTTVPGNGIIHQFVSRRGERFEVYVEHAGERRLVVYGAEDADTPLRTVALDPDEADQVAEVLHSRPLVDRVTALERQVAQLAGKAS